MYQEKIRQAIAEKKDILSHIGNRLTAQQLSEFTDKTCKEIKELEAELEGNIYKNMMQSRYGIDETRCLK